MGQGVTVPGGTQVVEYEESWVVTASTSLLESAGQGICHAMTLAKNGLRKACLYGSAGSQALTQRGSLPL